MNGDDRRKIAFWAWWGTVICGFGVVVMTVLLIATIVVAVR